MSPVTKLLRELIALPSVNPAFTSADDPYSGESRMVDYLSQIARSAGLEVSTHEVFPGRNNLIVSLKPRGRRRSRVLLAPHLDTVTVHDLNQFKPAIRSGKIFGRGACDTKGSVAAMLSALVRIATQGTRPKATEIVFAGLIDEESGQTGSRALVRAGFKADLAIVGEPTTLRVVTAHKGDLWLRLRTRGLSVHSSQPQLGDNAITQMARVVQLIEGRYAKSLRKRRHPLLGCATVNVGTIQGGKQPNIVPDSCEICVDRRTLPGEQDAGLTRELGRFLRAEGCRVSLVNWKGLPAFPMETDISNPYVQRLMQSAGQRKPVGVHYFSDAGVLRRGGIPSVVLGPGDIAQAHTADEWISIQQLEQGTDLYTRFLEGLE